jgi:alpha-D-ribose 1-methylphosphonate 5-triphosphate synthase subunit PhnH
VTASTLTGTVHVGLTPELSRRVFRAVLDALSRPGRPATMPGPVDPSGDAAPSALWPVLALADLSTGVAMLTDDEPDQRNWADLIRLATSAPPVEPGRARLVAALRPMTPDELRGLARGSAPAPEDAALATLAVPALSGGSTRLRLRGPGVDGSLVIAPRGLSAGLLAARAEAVSAFPAGVDLLLVDPAGALLGLPRSTSIEEVR